MWVMVVYIQTAHVYIRNTGNGGIDMSSQKKRTGVNHEMLMIHLAEQSSHVMDFQCVNEK